MNYYLLVLTLLCTTVYAQSPSKMSYQAVIRNSPGDLVINSPVKLRMSLLQGSIDGTEVYSEIHTSTTNTNGLITLEIGDGTVISGVLETIDWSNGPYFMKREVDPDGGSNYTIVGTSQLLSVPYAMYANVADTVLNIPDTSSTNEIQELSVSITGDTLYLSNSNYVIIPGLSNSNSPTITDYDGNIYKTVVIGNQVWMAENLRTAHYNDGELIPNITDNTTWKNLTTGARSYIDNDSILYSPRFGAFYNWYAVGTDKLCPTGWHVPSIEEWNVLINFLGGEEVAGGKLKEIGTENWNSPNEGATNEYGFSGIGAGARSHVHNGAFQYLLDWSYFWSSLIGRSKYLSYDNDNMSENGHYYDDGISVRCLKDL